MTLIRANLPDVPSDPSSNPFEYDKLDREESALILTQLIQTYDAPFVLGLDAAWGKGKTTFVKMWGQHLKNDGYRVLYFNAWENGFVADPLIGLLAELQELIREGNRDGSEELFESAKNLALRFARHGLPALIKGVAASAGIPPGMVDGALEAATSAVEGDFDAFKESKTL